MALTRGTTDSITFIVPCSLEHIEVMTVTIAQDEVNKIDLNYADNTEAFVVTSGEIGQVTCNLTQTDTLSLEAGKPAAVQLRVRNDAGVAYATPIVTVNVCDVLKEGVI